jgi:hypothetical protein
MIVTVDSSGQYLLSMLRLRRPTLQELVTLAELVSRKWHTLVLYNACKQIATIQ